MVTLQESLLLLVLCIEHLQVVESLQERLNLFLSFEFTANAASISAQFNGWRRILYQSVDLLFELAGCVGLTMLLCLATHEQDAVPLVFSDALLVLHVGLLLVYALFAWTFSVIANESRG